MLAHQYHAVVGLILSLTATLKDLLHSLLPSSGQELIGLVDDCKPVLVLVVVVVRS